MSYVIGLDYGTDSVRSVLVNTTNGKTVASHVFWYPRWREGKYCNSAKNQFRQHPEDHLRGMEVTIREAIASSGIPTGEIKGICIDTTGSSPVPVDNKGIPLALNPELAENPNAMMILWKDHTAIEEAEEINRLSRSWGGVDFTKYEGGIYSSEWFWAKILHVIREDSQVREKAYSWMEHCDLMTFTLTGGNLQNFTRSRCAAGHKAMWHASWGGLPSAEFLGQLDPDLARLRSDLYKDTYTSDQVAGTLSSEWARRLGLSEEVTVAVGTFDAHAGAVGAEVEEGTLVRVMGTSTCDIIVTPEKVLGEQTVQGICGQVDGSVIPGMIGLEAGQSAFGDLLAWFAEVILWPVKNLLPSTSLITEHQEKTESEIRDQLLVKLSEAAEKTEVRETGLVALDWINGRRTPDANQSLKSAIMNLTLGTQAPEIFRALVESICFGSRMIIDRFESEGVVIHQVVGIGGVAKKSGFIMQTLADVLNRPIKIAVSEQAPALGAAMYAAVACGAHSTLAQAKEIMGNGFEQTYTPRQVFVSRYDQLYEKYKALGEYIENSTID